MDGSLQITERRRRPPDASSRPSATGAFHTRTVYLGHLLFVLDMSLITLVYCTVLRMLAVMRPSVSLDIVAHLAVLPIILGGFALSRAVLGQHSDLGYHTVRTQVIALLKMITISVGAALALIFLLKLDYFSRLFFGSFALAVTATLVAMRVFIICWFFRKGGEALNVLIVGSGVRARKLAADLEGVLEWRVNVVGYLDPEGVSAGRRKDDRILGHVNEIARVLKNHVVEEVIIAVPRSLVGRVQAIIEACEEEGIRYRFAVDLYDMNPARIRLTMVEGVPLVLFEPVAQDETALVMKRIFDVVATLAMMPLMLPVFAIVAVAIKLDSRGPVFFSQDRVGLHKRHFRMLKFRSMVVDAEDRMKDLEHLNEAQGVNFKMKNDPRITRVGRFLRRSSIDELPQLTNVLRGDMSLVGPRPMSLRDVALIDKGVQRKRFSVRPGITGLWQISGRSKLTFDQWVELDIKYIVDWSFLRDLVILVKTMPAVMRQDGAY